MFARMIKSFVNTPGMLSGWHRASPPGLQHLAEERGGAWVGRRAKDLPRLALFLNHARSMKITRSATSRAKPISWVTITMVIPRWRGFHHLQHVAYQLRIQRRSGLIEQHYRRLHRQRAGDGYLLLAAGQARGPGVALIA